jgi:DNA-binding response OmpR family regulator
VKQLLYIEDNVVTQKMMRRHLEKIAAVSVAGTLAKARQLLASPKFDLVLADVNLPDGTSLDLVYELRARYSALQLPIVVVSAAMDTLLRAQAFRAGANECFAMPTRWTILLPALEQLLAAPYVGANENGALSVTWVEGKIDNRLWLYCPELDLRLVGTDLETLRSKMAERVRSAASEKNLPFVRGAKVTERLVDASPSA